MSLIRVAICEDDAEDRNTLKDHFANFEKEKGCVFSIKFFSNPVSFLENYTASYDLVLMDIDMPYLNGMEAAHRLRALDSHVTLAFVTNLANYAIEGYAVSAMDYILKPISYPEFSMKMMRMLRDELEAYRDYIVIPTRFSTVRIPLSDLIYIETKGHRVIFHTQKTDIEQYIALSALEKNLNGKGFSKCSSSYLVNLRYVNQVEGFTAFVGDTQLQISHGRKKQFVQDLQTYWKGTES